MQCLEVSGAVRPIYGSLGVKRLISALDGREWSASRPSRFTADKIHPVRIVQRNGWGLQAVWKLTERKICCC